MDGAERGDRGAALVPARSRAALQPLEQEEGDPSKYSKHNLALSLQEWEKLDVGAIALTTAKNAVQQRPALVAVWAVGLLLAALAGGLPVDDDAREAYSVMFQRAEVIDTREFGQQALGELETAEQEYYALQGWFGACDANCTRALDRVQLAREHAEQVRRRRDQVLSDARREVGIWSSFGVQDVRKSFWDAWKSGKDFAARMTMYDALFMVGGRDENVTTMVLKLVMQYVVNLSMGLVGAFFYFLHNLYLLIVSYGASFLSGLAFFLLAAVAAMSVVGTYIGGMIGGVAAGGIVMMQQAARQAALEADRRGCRSRDRLRDRSHDSKDFV
ncbi:unnamed protein product [Prorocentrum cordatum]|uniref:Transmembrane 9 superfamily member n=1 Tax=Prorocentrum cordatum TaxID=2364126 RepID=A0ABN9RN25_9DINO|nr:unnamed protein product [Polarella glacialis]